jgi:hypothetical protein
MPYLIFLLASVTGTAPVVLGLIIVAVAPDRTEAVVAVLREGRSARRMVRPPRCAHNAAGDPDKSTAANGEPP